MQVYYYILIILVSLSLGSFFNVIIFRFNTDQNATKGRSKCLKCHSTVRWLDLIPIFSYFILGGKCRNCGTKISPMYPVVEASTAAVLLLLFLNTQTVSYLTMLNALTVLLFMLVIFFDMRYFIIPDKILVLLTIIAIIFMLFGHNMTFPNLLISGLSLASFFAILFIASHGRWIGFGDVKLVLLIGLLLGYPFGFLAVTSSIWAATIFSVLLLATGRADLKTKIPLGSFLSATTIIFIIFNHELQEISKYFY